MDSGEGASDAGDNEDGENDGENDGDDDGGDGGEINGENDGDVTGVLVTGPSEIGVAAMDGPGEELDGAREGGTFGV